MQHGMTKSGFSLIEFMIAVLLFMVLLLGGIAVNYQSGSGILKQQFKREAIIQANVILEESWSQSFSDLRGWAGSIQTTNPAVNGKVMPATISYGNETTDNRGMPYIEISIDVNYGDSSGGVNMKTRRYPLGLSRSAL